MRDWWAERDLLSRIPSADGGVQTVRELCELSIGAQRTFQILFDGLQLGVVPGLKIDMCGDSRARLLCVKVTD